MSKHYDEPTYAVFGDVGGHYAPFANALAEFGVTINHTDIPKNLTIIQAGDLVHKGQSSTEIIAFVDLIMKKNNDDPAKGTWVQLFGNHESQYIKNAPRFWPMECSPKAIATIQSWWKNKQAKLHFVIPQNNGKDFVVSHAGISRFLYAKGLSRNIQKMTPETFYDHIESLQPNNMREASLAGAMLYGKISQFAGIFWAETVTEVYSTWKGQESPFHQIHGHVTPFSWPDEAFYSSVPPVFRKEITLNKVKRHSYWEHKGSMFIGIDPGFNKTYDREQIIPLLLNSNGIIH